MLYKMTLYIEVLKWLNMIFQDVIIKEVAFTKLAFAFKLYNLS